MLDELCLIDKPMDWTSFDVVAKLRNAYSKKIGKKCKVGHAGTLDPKATGLLLVAVGKKTKEIPFLEALDKEYVGEIKLGATTRSFDAETEEENLRDVSHLTQANLEETARAFLGKQWQLPPMHSATWHHGKRLYELARLGKEVERKPKPIEVFEFELTSIALPIVAFRIVVSKGAYIRAIANDFGARLGVGGYLKSLRRTRVGIYKVEDALSVEAALELIRTREFVA
ncbi:MAG: tRNA pseudouridine(55) synthase TruB [Chloroherpetonaceae bacterium]|nr:tRNA pseudouridine(55) synthase TruB [Chloroherpetonaceae bacterium]MDW8438413.1 tRNA pseudouridine(55) synthase TruB [Chloroherpetonaceae bacterium]